MSSITRDIKQHFMPRALYKLIKTREALGLHTAKYSYLRSQHDSDIVQVSETQLPPGCIIKPVNSAKNKYVIWEAIWPKAIKTAH